MVRGAGSRPTYLARAPKADWASAGDLDAAAVRPGAGTRSGSGVVPPSPRALRQLSNRRTKRRRAGSSGGAGTRAPCRGRGRSRSALGHSRGEVGALERGAERERGSRARPRGGELRLGRELPPSDETRAPRRPRAAGSEAWERAPPGGLGGGRGREPRALPRPAGADPEPLLSPG